MTYNVTIGSLRNGSNVEYARDGAFRIRARVQYIDKLGNEVDETFYVLHESNHIMYYFNISLILPKDIKVKITVNLLHPTNDNLKAGLGYSTSFQSGPGVKVKVIRIPSERPYTPSLDNCSLENNRINMYVPKLVKNFIMLRGVKDLESITLTGCAGLEYITNMGQFALDRQNITEIILPEDLTKVNRLYQTFDSLTSFNGDLSYVRFKQSQYVGKNSIVNCPLWEERHYPQFEL